MSYIDAVLGNPLFSQLAIAGLIIFVLFGHWKYYWLFMFLVFVTIWDMNYLKYAMIFFSAVIVFHYATASLPGSNDVTPLKDVTR